MPTKRTSVKATPVAAKLPRPLYSGSKLLEQSYAAFVARVIAEDIRTVSISETDEARFITLANIRRLRCDKKTGLLSCERWERTAEGERWHTETSSMIVHFWHSNTELGSTLHHAWKMQLETAIPSQELCYPQDSPKSRYLRDVMVSRAAGRRLGGKQRQTIALRMFTKALWTFLVDRDTLRLCHAFFGRKATLADYNFTVRRKKDLVARAQETPNLTRLVGAYIRITSDLRSGRRKLPMNILVLARTELFKPERAARIGGWEWGNEGSPYPFLEQNITPAGWRYLTAMTGATLERLWGVAQWDRTVDERAGQSPGPVLAAAVNLLAKTGEQAPATFAKWVVNTLPNWHVSRNLEHALPVLQDSAVRLVRLAAQQAILAKKKGRLKQFVRGDLLLVWDWFRAQGRDPGVPLDADQVDQPLVVPKNSTWASLMRAQHEWHAQRAERERLQRETNQRAHAAWLAKQDAITWTSALDECALDGVTVRPLTTGKALRDEGTEMNHCVGSYVNACRNGRSRIFALEHKGNRATLELVCANKNTWRVNQVFGPKNSKVPKALLKVSEAVAKLYQNANREALAQAA